MQPRTCDQEFLNLKGWEWSYRRFERVVRGRQVQGPLGLREFVPGADQSLAIVSVCHGRGGVGLVAGKQHSIAELHLGLQVRKEPSEIKEEFISLMVLSQRKV